MLKFLMVAGVILIVIAIIVMILAARQPEVFRVVRTTTINTPPEKVFEYLNSFPRWREWSPWENVDPDLVRNYSGPESGVGAAYAWEGNKEAGQGRMEIVESDSPRRVTVRLEFIRPFAAVHSTVFTLEPEGGATRLTWDMQGPNQCLGRVIKVFINMDQIIGGQFEEGLANLKQAAESA